MVISRRDRVRQDAADPGVTYGEVGGRRQYDADRGVWPIGMTVRAQARPRYALVAVDGTVRRVNEIAPGGRHKVGRKWEFTAVGGRELRHEEIKPAYGAGDECPTRVGGAYRPHWF